MYKNITKKIPFVPFYDNECIFYIGGVIPSKNFGHQTTSCGGMSQVFNTVNILSNS